MTAVQHKALRDSEAAESISPPTRAIETRAWLVWVASALIVGLALFNPWYQLILIGIVVLLWPGDSDSTPLLRFELLVRIAILAVIIGSVFNLLVVRIGDTVLFRLPETIPILGGPYTAESLVYGAINALRFVSLFFAFALFNRFVQYADLLRLAPAALFELGLVLSIGFTLAPSMMRVFNEIREAQALRGHQARGVRDLLPLFAPLVVSGMERAITLAESMETRGYGAPRDSGRRGWRGIAALVALISLVVLLLINTFAPLPTLLMVGLLSPAILVIALALRGTKRSQLRRGYWGVLETLAAVGAAVPAVVTMFIVNRADLVYDVYRMSTVGLPPFDPWLTIALLGFAVPLLRVL